MTDRREEASYTMRELEHFFKDIRNDIIEIKTQTQKTNGRILIHDRVLLVVGTILVVLLITNGSQLIQVFKILI